MVDSSHAKPYPDGKDIERAGIGVITLTHLQRRLIKVHHDGDARKQEQQERYPAVLSVLSDLIEQSNESQQKRQEEIVVLALGMDDVIRTHALVSQARFIKSPDPALPVPLEKVRGFSVIVVLTAHEVPHDNIVLVKTVHEDLKKLDLSKYQMFVFYSPSDISSLQENFPDFKQGEMLFATYGPSTAKAMKTARLKAVAEAPTPEAPSVAKAIELYLGALNASK